jgi:hypothetical protein
VYFGIKNTDALYPYVKDKAEMLYSNVKNEIYYSLLAKQL